MTSYISGAGGFIGSHLHAQLPDLVAIPHAEIIGYPFEPCDRFFFCSGYGNMASHTDKHKIVRANLTDMLHVLHRAKPEWFCYLSTSQVPMPVETSYANTKRAAEYLIARDGTPSCIIRPFSVTGCGEQEEHLIPTLIRSCMTGAEMPFVPNATHDFVDVEDVVAGILMLAEQRAVGTFELGRGWPIANWEVLVLVQEACGKEANIRVVDSLRSYDSKDWYAREPAKGWEPKKKLKQTIEEMVSVYRP